MADNEKVEVIVSGKFEHGQEVINTTKEIQKGLDGIGNEAEKTEKKSSLLTTTLKRLAAVVGITVIANQFKNLTKGSLEAAGAMEQVDIALTTMLGSGEKAKKLTSDLVTFAKATPFEIQGIFDTTKQLLAYGVAADDVIPTMNMLGNIAAGVGVDMQRLALAFGQVKTTGHLMGQDLNQFTQAGVPLLAALAQTLGKSEAEILKLKESGSISFAAVKTALEGMTQEGGKFYNLMQNQSKTFLGTVSNMSDSFYQVKIAIGDALLPVAKEAVNSMIAWFGRLKIIIEENKESITKFAQGVSTAFGLIVTAFKAAWTILSSFISGVKILLGLPLIKEVLAAAGAVLVFSKGLGVLTIAFRILTTTAFGWISALVLATTAIGYFSKGIDEMPNFIKTACLNALKLFELFKLGVFDFIESILDKLSLLSNLPFFGWVDDAKKKFADLKQSSISDIEAINKELENINSPKVEPAAIEAAVAKDSPTAKPDDLLAPEDSGKLEQKRLKSLKDENSAMLEEQKNFLSGYGVNETESDKLLAENKTLALQQQILSTQEYQAKVNEIQQQLLNDEITREQYKAQLLLINNEARNEALQTQYDAENVLYVQAQTAMNEIKLQMQATQDEAELEQLQLKLDSESQKQLASQQQLSALKSQMQVQTFEQKKKQEEDSLKHTLKMDTDGFKAAQGAANELVALQNSKNKSLAAIGKAAAIFNITVKTAEGAISAYSSLAPIPIVGPGLGAAAAAAIVAYGAEQLSTATSASFAVGTPNIPQDQMAMVHQGEMIVPATFSDAIRSGKLSLSGNDGGDFSSNNSSNSSSTNIIINFEGAQFFGQMNDENIKQIGEKLGQMINEDLIVGLPQRRAY
jgi:tape measure domain-containing protein